MNVSTRFSTFLSNLTLTTEQRVDGRKKHRGVRSCLNKHYYGWSSDTAHSMLVGSWGKSTEIRPPRDIDVLFVLPESVREKKSFASLAGILTGTARNVQSELLQEVKGVLLATYPTTKMRADGQVVVVPFGSYAVEVLPAFEETGLLGVHTGRYEICDTHDGGKFKTIDPNAEKKKVKDSNDATGGNTRDLIRMSKCWQGFCKVPLKSFCIELLAIEFLAGWTHSGHGKVYYDWMVRDFFAFLVGRAGALACVYVPGTNEMVFIGDSWKSRAQTAYNRARKACDYEADDMPYSAGGEWQKIFGSDIPTG